MLKKVLVLVFLLFVSFAPFFIPIVSSQDWGLTNFSKGAGYSTDTRDVYANINTVVSVFLSMIGIILLGLMLYGGIRWMTAQGNDDKVQKAKDIIEAAGVGMAIVLAAYGISYLVFNKLIR